MSIDPGQLLFMGSGVDLPGIPAKRFELGKPLEGQAVGQVIESRKPDVPVGAYVLTHFGWREYFVSQGISATGFFEIIDAGVAPVQTYLHVMGGYGAAAYYGLTEAGQIKAGETILVSTAGGNTGSIACQIAKLAGCRVVGSTGSDEKVRWLLTEIGIDGAINYRKVDSLQTAIGAACPDGIDVFWDTVGGEHLEAAINLMNLYGRVILIGQTPSYIGKVPPGPKNIFLSGLKRLRMQGFTVWDYLNTVRMSKYRKLMGKWIAEGKIKWKETVYEGIENAVEAQIGIFEGKNIGKMLVKLGDPERTD